MSTRKTGPRKRLPRKLAVINADNCTGCEACVEVCPVDCIDLITEKLGVMGVQSWCEVDLERCIGCELCVRLPRRKTKPYELTVCPWDAIEIVPIEQVEPFIVQMGGPPGYVREHHARLVGTARHLAELGAQAEERRRAKREKRAGHARSS